MMKRFALLMIVTVFGIGFGYMISEKRHDWSHSKLHLSGKNVDFYVNKNYPNLAIGFSETDKGDSVTLHCGNAFPSCQILFGDEGIKQVRAINNSSNVVNVETSSETKLFSKLTLLVPSEPGKFKGFVDKGLKGFFEEVDGDFTVR